MSSFFLWKTLRLTMLIKQTRGEREIEIMIIELASLTKWMSSEHLIPQMVSSINNVYLRFVNGTDFISSQHACCDPHVRWGICQWAWVQQLILKFTSTKIHHMYLMCTFNPISDNSVLVDSINYRQNILEKKTSLHLGWICTRFVPFLPKHFSTATLHIAFAFAFGYHK